MAVVTRAQKHQQPPPKQIKKQRKKQTKVKTKTKKKKLPKSKTTEIDNLLRRLYYDPVTGYTGVDPLLAVANVEARVPRSVVTEWLAQEPTYSLHRPAIERGVKHQRNRNKILSKGIDYAWQSDLVDVQPLSRQNRGYRYLMTVVDTFSRYAWVRPLKSKSGHDVATALIDIFRNGRKPQKLCTDMGREYENKDVEQMLQSQGIVLYTVASDNKAALAERFNRTLKERMWRYFTANNGKKRYIDVLQQLVDGYNRRRHRSIGMSPVEASKKHNEKRLWQHQYADAVASRQRKKPKYVVGQMVRISIGNRPFAKGYVGKWTKELFRIAEVKTNQRQPMYILLDPRDDKPIKGGFYERQLQLS